MDPALSIAWRFTVLAGFVGGLGLSPQARDLAPEVAVLAAVSLLGLGLLRPHARARSAAAIAWLITLALVTAIIGFAIGDARLDTIDRGAIDLEPGSTVTANGFVVAPPSTTADKVAVRIATADGRLQIDLPPPSPELSVGDAVSASGVIRDPSEFERGRLERFGVRDVLAARSIVQVDGGRTGISGLLDEIRGRAEIALTSGTSPASANLLLGFVLGQDDRIAESTADDYKASGLAHLLAVSGQNIVLLLILAGTALAVLGVGLRARLLWMLALVAIYVPVAGAGASIQRAGVMGAAGLVATLTGRPRQGWYAVLLAAAATLALDPRASADIGWQLSFAAVVGILLFARRVALLLAAESRSRWRRGLAEATGVTVAATLATGPLMAHHFETVSLVSLPANLVALPAVAPLMWLGMASAAAGQLPGLPVEPLTWLAGLLAGFISQVASWFAELPGAQAELGLDRWWAVAVAYAIIGLGLLIAVRCADRRRRLGLGPSLRPALVVVGGALVALATLAMLTRVIKLDQGSADAQLRISVLDVGQGDAILLQPARGGAILVDTGPPGSEIVEQLERHGVDRLAALAVTHPDLDHDGEAVELLRRLPVERLLHARADAATLATARAAGTDRIRISAGSRLRSGALRLDVLWPPREQLAGVGPPAEPNALSLVIVARWRDFEILLSGDTEAETVVFDSGDVEVLKLAHHGSDDLGLPELLADATPELALISVGAEQHLWPPDTQAHCKRSAKRASRCSAPTSRARSQSTSAKKAGACVRVPRRGGITPNLDLVSPRRARKWNPAERQHLPRNRISLLLRPLQRARPRAKLAAVGELWPSSSHWRLRSHPR